MKTNSVRVRVHSSTAGDRSWRARADECDRLFPMFDFIIGASEAVTKVLPLSDQVYQHFISLMFFDFLRKII